MKPFVSILLAMGLMFSFSGPLARAGTAEEDANNVYEDTEAFDGGPGSTINTSPDYEDGDADYSLDLDEDE